MKLHIVVVPIFVCLCFIFYRSKTNKQVAFDQIYIESIPIPANETFSQNMVKIISKTDREIQVMHRSITIAQRLLVNTANKDALHYCIELLRGFEMDYFSLQRKTIAGLYEEKIILNTLLANYDKLSGYLYRSDMVTFKKIIGIFENKIIEFRKNINQIIKTQFDLIVKAKTIEAELLSQSIDIIKPLILEKIKMIFYTTSGVLSVPAIMMRCGTHMLCITEAIFVTIYLESFAYDEYQTIVKKRIESEETSGVIVQMSLLMSSTVSDLELKIQQYEHMLHRIHQLNSLYYQAEKTDIVDIKVSLKEMLLKMKVFLE